jgi:hypothetical protein
MWLVFVVAFATQVRERLITVGERHDRFHQAGFAKSFLREVSSSRIIFNDENIQFLVASGPVRMLWRRHGVPPLGPSLAAIPFVFAIIARIEAHTSWLLTGGRRGRLRHDSLVFYGCPAWHEER